MLPDNIRERVEKPIIIKRLAPRLSDQNEPDYQSVAHNKFYL